MAGKLMAPTTFVGDEIGRFRSRLYNYVWAAFWLYDKQARSYRNASSVSCLLTIRKVTRLSLLNFPSLAKVIPVGSRTDFHLLTEMVP